MNHIAFPVIDPVATGENIQRLRRERGLSVRDLQNFFGFEEPQAIYKWQRGKSLPSVDNLYALSALLDVSMDDIIVSKTIQLNRYNNEQQAAACCSAFIRILYGSTGEKSLNHQFNVLRNRESVGARSMLKGSCV